MGKPSAVKVWCPLCGAPPGTNCSSASGSYNSWRSHQRREDFRDGFVAGFESGAAAARKAAAAVQVEVPDEGQVKPKEKRHLKTAVSS